MARSTTLVLTDQAPAPPAPTGGCTTCWAANYCAAFVALATLQPPPNCPLLPQPRRPSK